MGDLLGREGTGDRGEGMGWAAESRGQRYIYMNTSPWTSLHRRLNDKGLGRWLSG